MRGVISGDRRWQREQQRDRDANERRRREGQRELADNQGRHASDDATRDRAKRSPRPSGAQTCPR